MNSPPLPARHRNIVFKCALIVMSLALAAFGVLGWAHAARGFDAYAARSWAVLDPIWPVYAMAAIACLAAQFIAACAVVNFARLTHSSAIWRALAVAFYAVAVFFAAYSADEGAKVIMGSAHRAAYEANQDERHRLESEIASLTQIIADERARLPSDTANTYASRQDSALAIFEAATAAARTRLPEAQRELRDLPLVAREQITPWQSQALVFLIFLAWAVLEPWGYALAERGRERMSYPSRRIETNETVETRKSHAVSWPFKTAGLAVALAASASQASAQPPGNAGILNLADSDSVVRLPDTSRKAKAFALRGRIKPALAAIEVGVSRATIYRWYRERDKALQAARAA